MRSKLGCQASNLLCSAMLNNAIIEGTVDFRRLAIVSVNFFCALRSVQIHFFRPSKKQHTVEKGSRQNSGRTQLSKVRLFFLSWFCSFSTVCWNGWLHGRPEKTTVLCGPRPKTKQKMKLKKQKNYKFCWAPSALEPAYRSVPSAILKLGFRRAAMNVSCRGSLKIGLHSGKASKLKAKISVFVHEKRGLFFTP